MRQQVAPTTPPTKASPKGNERRRVVESEVRTRSTAENTNHVISPDVRRKKVRPIGGFGAGTAAATREKTKKKEECVRKVPERKELLLQRLEESDGLVRALKEEVLGLKKKMEDLEVRNIVLETQNRMGREDLAAAQTKIQMLESLKMEKESEFRDSKNRMAVHLEIAQKQTLISPKSANTTPAQTPTKVTMASPPPPPPPPPPRHTPTKTSAMRKETPSLVEFYHSLTKRERETNSPSGLASCSTSVVNKAHSNIVGEIQNRSSHLLAIKADVETKGEFIKSLITKVHTMIFTGIEDLLDFVEWLDKELSTLADERAVLKHFNWPEQKADAMREAAFEYRALKRLHDEVSLFEDDRSLTFEASLKKMENLLNKSERSIQRLTKLRDGTMASYCMHKIPTNWMFDSGIIRKIKLGTMKLAKICMNRVPAEVAFDSQESLLLHCIRFSYRVHQFTGGLDVETTLAFEDLRRRIHPNPKESQELLPRIISF